MGKPEPIEPPRSAWGCFFYGCLFSFLVFVVLAVGSVFAGYWFVSNQVTRFTAAEPANLPVVEYSEEEIEVIETRIETFHEALDEGDAPNALVLTADEINAMIASQDELRGRVYVAIEDGEVSAELSFPADALPGGTGRYLNASVSLHVALEDSELVLDLKDAEILGEEVPEKVLQVISREVSAAEFQSDPEVAAQLARFESLTVEGDRIVLTPRQPE